MMEEREGDVWGELIDKSMSTQLSIVAPSLSLSQKIKNGRKKMKEFEEEQEQVCRGEEEADIKQATHPENGYIGCS